MNLGWLTVALAGGVGAVARFAADTAITSRVRSGWPLGTMAVNIIGCFALGLLVGLVGDHRYAAELVGTGFLGGFTTFSAAVVEAAMAIGEDRAAQDGKGSGRGGLGRGLGPAAFTLAAGVAAAAAGLALGRC